MRFLHCERCGATARVEAGPQTASLSESFRQEHKACRLETFEPTGRAEASAPWHEPMATRRLEVRGEDGLAMAVGARRLLDEPVLWRIERRETEETTEVELDRALFWATVDRALFPGHLPQRALDEWANQVEHFARSTHPSDIVLLEDDPQSGNATFACLTLTARARLEAGLRLFGFDRQTEEQLAALFDEELFPPLRVRRRLLFEGSAAADAGPTDDSLTREPRLV